LPNTEPPAKIFLVDDDDSVRHALQRLIRSAGYSVHAFGSAQEFLASGYQSAGPACLVLDVSMPGVSGQELYRELQRLKVILPVIFITGHGDIAMGVAAMKAGAADFLPKPIDEKELLRAIGNALSRAIREREEKEERDSIYARLDSLTNREREVLPPLVAGMLNKQIAAELGIVEKTVKVHRARLMRKMKVQSVAELVQLVMKIDFPRNKAAAAATEGGS
jgi:RNA polymerase sigma factor (sigma-70 family)